MAESLTPYALNEDFQKAEHLQKIGIIGCGTVGQEIARITSQYGMDVIFVETGPERVAHAMRCIEEQLDEMINRWGITAGDKRVILSRIKGSSQIKDLEGCHLIIEAISTMHKGTGVGLDIRKEMFKELEDIVSPETVLASNSATILISDLSADLKYPGRVVGLSFMVSPVVGKVIEVVRGNDTTDEVYALAARYAELIHKKPVEVMESPGNISTRMLITLINEACEIFLEGTAGIQEIDDTMKYGYGLQWGPFELADKVGLDRIVKYADHLFMEFGLFKFKASPLLKRLVRTKHLGRSTGSGFYKYDEIGREVAENLFSPEISRAGNLINKEN